jgi:hypothetical protein
VTDGNRASELLLADLGFVCVTPPVGQSEAITYYRAAAAIRVLEGSDPHAVAASLEDAGPTLWVFRDGGVADVTVDIRDTAVRIVSVSPNDPRVPEIANRSIPIQGAPWLLGHRTTSRP